MYVVLDRGDKTFSWLAVGLLIVGSALQLFASLKGVEVLLLGGNLCHSLALGEVLRVGLPSVSDLWNNVNFIGGNSQLALKMIIVFSGIAIFSCILCFVCCIKKQKDVLV